MVKQKSPKLETVKQRKKPCKLVVWCQPDGSITSTFHHSDGRKTVEVCK